MTRWARPAGALFILLGLSGCQALASLGGDTTEDPVDSSTATSANAPITTARSTPADAPPVVINDDPDQFLGLAGAAIGDRLGEPDLVRRDGPAEVRQFRGSACVLDLFLYQEGDDLTVRYVELRGASLEADARRQCLVDMIRARSLTG